MPDFKLGKLPKRTDPRTLQLSRYTTGLTPPPAAVNNGAAVTVAWGMLGNDTVGDCTCAGAGHAEMTWSALDASKQLGLTTQEILAAYSAITGYIPGEPSTDKGADLLTVLRYWHKTGIVGQKIGAYAEITPTDVSNIKLAIDLFGVAYVGVNLPDAALPHNDVIVPFTTTIQAGQPDTQPNPNNGHCIIYVAYDAEGLTAITWGQTNPVSWGFNNDYCDELYAIIPPEIVNGDDTPAGLDLAQLQADLKAIKS